MYHQKDKHNSTSLGRRESGPWIKMQVSQIKTKGDKIMIASLKKNVLAGMIVLALAAPGWATEAAKGSPAQQENMQNKSTAVSSDKIIKVQEALKAKGDDPGATDGIMGRKTRAALKSFQKANGLKSTGTVDDQTAEKLGVQKP